MKEGVLVRQGGATSAGSSLSGDFLSAAGERLGVVGLVIGAVALLGLVINLVLYEILDLPPRSFMGLRYALSTVLIASSVAVFAVSRSGLSPRRILDVGGVYQLLGAGMIAFLAFWGPGDSQTAMWVGVWIVLFPLILPARPLRHAILGSLCALMAPTFFVISTLAAGEPMPGAGSVFKLTLPYGMCVFLSVVSGALIYRLGKELTESQADVRRLGSYKLVKKLGVGGMGEVWLAEHHVLSRPAAIKLIKADVFAAGSEEGREEALSRFEREARTTAALSSPHTIGLYDFGTTADGTIYYVMELLRGIDLDQLVTKFGAVSPARAVALLRQACDSLAEAHGAGLIHRDIKPANLYLSRLGRTCDFVKVLDFGLVTHAERDGDEESAKLTGKNFIVGTPAFMAPEQVTGDAELSASSDVYALGCVGYWLVTGKWVFEQDSAMRILLDHVGTLPTPPSKRAKQDIPEALDRLLMACLEKDPADRPKDMEAFSAQLGALELSWTQEEARAWWGDQLPELLTTGIATGPDTGGVDVGAETVVTAELVKDS